MTLLPPQVSKFFRTRQVVQLWARTWFRRSNSGTGRLTCGVDDEVYLKPRGAHVHRDFESTEHDEESEWIPTIAGVIP